MIDSIIKTNGLDWDQPRSVCVNRARGFDTIGDFVAIRQRPQKHASILAAFEAGAFAKGMRKAERFEAGASFMVSWRNR